jgi:hypothetical protein
MPPDAGRLSLEKPTPVGAEWRQGAMSRWVSRTAILGALGIVLVLAACGSTSQEAEHVVAASGQIPPDLPGASREELARIPEQFPLDLTPGNEVDAVVNQHQGRESLRLSVVTEGRADANALFLADEFAALGWNVERPTAGLSDNPSFRFEGFGWSGEVIFQPRDDAKAEMVVDLLQAR